MNHTGSPVQLYVTIGTVVCIQYCAAMHAITRTMQCKSCTCIYVGGLGANTQDS